MKQNYDINVNDHRFSHKIPIPTKSPIEIVEIDETDTTNQSATPPENQNLIANNLIPMFTAFFQALTSNTFSPTSSMNNILSTSTTTNNIQDNVI